MCSPAAARAQMLEYTANRGQWPAPVLYQARLNAGALFLEKDGYRVLQYHSGDYALLSALHSGHAKANGAVPFGAGMQPQVPDDGTMRAHAYKVRFANTVGSTQSTPSQEMPGYTNYFLGNDPAKWASGVKSYGVVQFAQLYRGIDIRYYSDDGYVKYDLLASAGAAVQDIAMVYEGVEGLRTDKQGNLIVKTSVGEMMEKAPYSYQVEHGVRRSLESRYVVSGNTVRFKLQGYNPQLPLVIDPTFVFSTFAGSPPDNWGYTATFDKEGNAYGGGIVFGNGYPTTPGAFQVTFAGGTNTGESAGGFDISIIKLDPLGRTRIYSTYLGGSSNEQPHSLVVNNQNELIMAGRTLSSNYPVRGLGNVGQGGLWDVVVTKFSADGTQLVGSVKIGGTGDDGVNDRHKFPNPQPAFTNQNYGDDARSEVITDAQGNIYVAGSTKSNNFPVTPGALQNTLRGAQDALVLKFNPNLSALEFATYLGGGNYDAAYVLIVEPGGDLLVAGGTMSNDFPGDKSGTVGTNFAGGLLDGFIARISADGTTLRKTTYVGTTGNDQIYGIQRDINGFLYVMGTSTGNFPVRNAVFSQTGGKQFIAKLQPDLSAYVYSTVFGTNQAFPNLSPTAFLVDKCENVYVSGWGGNIVQGAPYPIAPTTGLTVTPNAIKSVTDGMDFYFFVLERNAASQLYGSFFGQQAPTNTGSHDHVDGGTSRFDEDGIIYQGMCANCNGGQFPTTPGTLSPSNPSSRCNLAIAKINFNLSGVRTGVQSFVEGVRRDSSTCVPAVIDFVDSIAIGRRFEWSFGDGSPVAVTDSPRITYTYRTPGNYTVRLIAIDESKCIPRDTSFMNIRVRIDRVPMNATATQQPPCESLLYRFDNLSTPFPGKPFRDSSFIWLFGDNSAAVRAGLEPVTHRYPGPGVYNVRLVLADTNYCNAPDTFRLTVRVAPNVSARFTAPLQGCAPFSVGFTNTSLGGSAFEWDFGNGLRSTLVNPQVVFTQPGQYRVRLTGTDPNSCNRIDSTFVTINVIGAPQSLFSVSPQPPQENIPATFTNLSDPSAIRFRWSFGDGDTLLTLRRDTLVRHQYPRTDEFNACLIAINSFGCADTTCLPVRASVEPLVDVVTAFTPNGDGVNDRAVVIGFGVRSMVFRIFNRWGQLMYEGTDIRQGWDGNFKGVPQPMDAYAYTLDAELLDGEKVRKAGNITLIR